MIIPNPIEIFDGDHEIIYSGDFNIYNNKLRIKPIFGTEFIFIFSENKYEVKSTFNLESEDSNKKIVINFINFSSTFGTGTMEHVPIASTSTNKQLFFSIHVKSLNKITSFLKVSVTFYLK